MCKNFVAVLQSLEIYKKRASFVHITMSIVKRCAHKKNNKQEKEEKKKRERDNRKNFEIKRCSRSMPCK